MAISKDLFLALLSMDAYNRGYGAGIADGVGPKDANGNDADGLGRINSLIGGAKVIADANDQEAQDAGFYAVAYEVPISAWEGLTTPTTVISYRGTDGRAKPDSGGAFMTIRNKRPQGRAFARGCALPEMCWHSCRARAA